MDTRSKILLGISIDAVGVGRLPEVFADAGCEVTVACGAGLAVTSSRFVTHNVRTGRSPNEVREGLEDHLSRNPDLYSRVVLADEPLLRTFLIRPAAPGLAGYVPLLGNPQRLARILSKISFIEDAASAGIPVPAWRVLRDRDELAREKWAGRPFVLKMEESMSGSGVHVIRTAGELEAAKTLGDGPYLVQDYVPGKVAATAVLYDRGVPRCWFSYIMCRNWPNAVAAASALEVFLHPEVESSLVALGKMTAMDGLCGVDWVVDPNTGRPMLIEMNPRPIPGMRFSHVAGVSFPQAVANWIQGNELDQRPAERPRRLYRMFPQNLYRAIDDCEPQEFLLTWVDAPWRDPQLLLSQTRRVATHYLPASWRERWKRRRA